MSTPAKLAIPMLLAIAGVNLAVGQGFSGQLDCNDRWRGGGRSSESVCEIREVTLPARDSLSIDGGGNGGVIVRGWDRDEIQVRAQVVAWSRDEDDAQELFDQITIQTDSEIHADGPRSSGGGFFSFGNRGGWNVTFEVMAPEATELRIDTVNGGIAIADIEGDVIFEGTNGGVSLDNVTGNVRGRTVNGGVSVDFSGDTLSGDEFDVRTTNGGVVLSVPENFSARLEVGTVNGGIHVDFPVTVSGRINRELTTTLGDGGPLLRVRTVNGGVRIGRD